MDPKSQPLNISCLVRQISLKLHSFFPNLTMSPTASVHSAKEAPTAERAQPAETVDEYEDAEKNFQPRSPKFWSIIIGMYLSIFLVALVTSLYNKHFQTDLSKLTCQ